MKNILKVIFIGILAIVSNPIIAQPPGFPPAHEEDGKITPVDRFKEVIIWTVNNHTECEFKYKLFFSFTNPSGERTGGSSTGDNYQIVASGESKEWNVSTMFMDHYGDWTNLTNISMEFSILGWKYYAYPSGETKIFKLLDGTGPCACFKIDFNETTRTIDIWPC